AQVQRNVRDAVFLVQSTEGALEELASMTQRLRQLSVEAANGVLTDEDRALLQVEADQLVEEIDDISNHFVWNGRYAMENYVENLGPTVNNAVDVGYLVGDMPDGVHTVTVTRAAERCIIETSLPWETTHEQDGFVAAQQATDTPVYNTGRIDFHAAIDDKTQVGILDEVWSVERGGSEFLLNDETTANPEWIWVDDATGGTLIIPGTSATNRAIEFDDNAVPTQAAAWTFNVENSADATAVTLPIRNGSLVIQGGDGVQQAVTVGGTFYNTDTDMVGETLSTGGWSYGFNDWRSVTDENVTSDVTGAWSFVTDNNGYDLTLSGGAPVVQNDARVYNAGAAPATQTGYVKNTASGTLVACTAGAGDIVSISAGPTNELAVSAVRTYGYDISGEAVALADTSALADQRGTVTLANTFISNAAQTGLGSSGSSSLSFSGGVLTTEVASAAAVTNDGDYFVNYTTGVLTYKLTTGAAAETADYSCRHDFNVATEVTGTNEAAGDFSMAAGSVDAGETVYVSYSYTSGLTLNTPGRTGGTIDLLGAAPVTDGAATLTAGVDYSYNNATGVLTFLSDNTGAIQVDYDYNLAYSTAGASVDAATGTITLSAANNAGRPALNSGGTVLADYAWQDDQTTFVQLAGPSSYGGNMMVSAVTVNGLPGGITYTWNSTTGRVNFSGAVDPGAINIDYTYRARYTVTGIDYNTGSVSVANAGANNTPDPTAATDIGDYTFDYDWYHTVRIGYYQLDDYALTEDSIYVAQDVNGDGALDAGDHSLSAGTAVGQYIIDQGGMRLNGQNAVDPDPDYDGARENPAVYVDYTLATKQTIDTNPGGRLDRTSTIGEKVPDTPGDAYNNDGLFNDFWGTDQISFTCDGVRLDVAVHGTDTVDTLINRINARADEEGCKVTASFNESTGQLRLAASEEGTRYTITVNDDDLGPENAAGAPQSSLNFVTVQNAIDPTVSVTMADGTTSAQTSDCNDFSVTNSGITGCAYHLNAAAVVGWTAQLRNNAASFHIGTNADQMVDVTFRDVRASSLTVDRINVTTQAAAEASINVADTALGIISDYRTYLGAVEQMLSARDNYLSTAQQTQLAAESRVTDLDMAAASVANARGTIMLQAGQAIMAQANLRPQSVLDLLQQ
ncbi:MAG TPA: flagellin, partial [bacterium]|nr:flagellin [bacterium]